MAVGLARGVIAAELQLQGLVYDVPVQNINHGRLQALDLVFLGVVSAGHLRLLSAQLPGKRQWQFFACPIRKLQHHLPQVTSARPFQLWQQYLCQDAQDHPTTKFSHWLAALPWSNKIQQTVRDGQTVPAGASRVTRLPPYPRER